MQKIVVAWLSIVFLISCSKPVEKKLVIAAASSLRPVLEEICGLFTETEAIEVDLITASSGKLSAQIEAGAPYDIFLSANNYFPEYLQTKLNLNESYSTFAYGRLVFLSSSKYKNKYASTVSAIGSEKLKKIVIPNPKIAPYGVAALEVLKHLGLDLLVTKKLIYAESVGQCNQFLTSEAVDAGFTSLSTLKGKKNTDIYTVHSISDTLYTPISNSILFISKKENTKQKAQKFKTFLQGEKSRLILKKYGYIIP